MIPRNVSNPYVLLLEDFQRSYFVVSPGEGRESREIRFVRSRFPRNTRVVILGRLPLAGWPQTSLDEVILKVIEAGEEGEDVFDCMAVNFVFATEDLCGYYFVERMVLRSFDERSYSDLWVLSARRRWRMGVLSAEAGMRRCEAFCFEMMEAVVEFEGSNYYGAMVEPLVSSFCRGVVIRSDLVKRSSSRSIWRHGLLWSL